MFRNHDARSTRRHRLVNRLSRKRCRRRMRCESLEDRRLLAVLLMEDFEDNTINFSTSTDRFHDGSNDYFDIVPLNGPANSVDPYTGFGGSNFFAVEDMDDGGTRPDTGILEFNVNVAGFNNLSLDLLFAAGGNGATTLPYDDEESFLVRATLDSNPIQNLLAFEAEEPGGDISNNRLLQDTNFDGIGDGFEPSEAFTALNGLAITGTGSNLKIEIIVTSTDGNSEFAIDNVVVNGDVATGPPTAALSAAPNVDEGDIGGTAYSFDVTYADDVGVDVSSIDINDVSVSGPGGSLTVTGATVSGGDGSPRTATYTATPPGGAWDSTDNGTYTVSINAGQVSDTETPPRTALAGAIGTFDVNATNSAPYVLGIATNHVLAANQGSGSVTFTIDFADGFHDINAGTIDISDVAVTGPGGPLTVSGVTTSPAGNGNPLSATYTVSAPGGTWDPADDGTYTIDLIGSQVEDVLGGAVPADPGLGTFVADSTLSLLEDFEDNVLSFVPSNGLFYSGADHFTITPLNGPSTSNEPYIGFDRNHFSAEDMNGDGGPATQTLTFNVDIANRENLMFEGLFAVGGNGASPPRYDADESLLVRASIDGNAFENLFALEAEEPGGDMFNNLIKEDTDFDGVGDGFQPTSTAFPVSRAITGVGTNLTLEIIVTSDDNDAEFAFDQILISGDSTLGDPVASLVSPQDVGEINIGETAYDLTVSFTDDMAIDAGTLDIGDVTVTGPGGPLTVTGINFAAGNGSPKTVTYTVTPPGGSWDAADNGVYTVDINANEVGDTDTPQRFVPAGNLGVFNVDATNTDPFVIDSVAEHITSDRIGETDYTFTVTFDDINGINTATIDINDVTVIGPGGPLLVTGASTTDPSGSTPATATYSVSPPGGDWDPADNGLYEISINAGEIADSVGGTVAAGLIDLFVVDSNLLLIEDFEDNLVEFSSSNGIFHDGNSDYFTIVPLNGPDNTQAPHAGFEGANFFAAEDINGEGGPDTQSLTFNVDISSFQNLQFSGLFAVGGNGATTPAYDAEEGLLVRASVDGGAFQNLFAIEAVEPGGDLFNNVVREDTDFDGVGDGFLFNENFVPISPRAIAGAGSNLVLEVIVTSTDGNSEFAFDLFEITGDPAVTPVNLSVDSNAGSEAAGTTITVIATADNAVVGDQTVDIDVSGLGITATDYMLIDPTITILNGQTTGTATFTIQDDVVVEASETATLQLVNLSPGLSPGGTISQDIAITDNDTATLTINDVSANENAGTLDFVLSLDAPVDVGLDVDVLFGGGNATGGGVDYNDTTQSFHFPMIGTGSMTVSVPLINDADFEPDETFNAILNVTTVLGGRNVVFSDIGTGTILNDDPAPPNPNAIGIDVQNGEYQRSFIDEVDILFSGSAGLQDLINNGNIRVERFGIGPGPVVPGTGTNVPFSGASVVGNGIQLDFAGGIGGAGSAGNGFYRILLDTDNNGNFDDAHFEFFRLYGDANGDGIVTTNDTRIRADLDGNGRFDTRDRRVARNNLGASVDLALLAMIDD